MTASGTFKDDIYNRLEGLKAEGLYKSERVIASPQRAEITLQDGQEVINLCANNYLGLADGPAVIAAAHKALTALASAWPVCGLSAAPKSITKRLSSESRRFRQRGLHFIPQLF